MMMKKKLFIIVFFLLCLIPSLGMLVLGPSPLLANETAPKTPSLKTRDGSLNPAFLSEITDYMGTRFALRPAMVSARSWLHEQLFRTSAEEQVILGSDGELYYSSTLEDYAGVGLTDSELRQIAEKLAAIQAAVEAEGGSFLFTVAPNKNSLIPERMPERFPSGHGQSNYARLLPLLDEYGVNHTDLQTVLAGHPDWYYRTDSHWTPEGAAVAADALLAALGRESGYASGPFRSEGRHVGDLYQMLYPIGKGREAELRYGPALRYETASDPRGGNAMRIQTTSSAGSGSLFCRRDSFGIALYPYLADAFAAAEFSRSDDYSLEAFSGLGADVVILEIVERNLKALL